MNIFIRYLFLYSFILVYVTSIPNNISENGNVIETKEDKVKKAIDSSNFNKLEEILNHFKENKINVNESSNLDAFKNIINSNSTSQVNLQNILKMLNLSNNTNNSENINNNNNNNMNFNNTDINRWMELLKQFNNMKKESIQDTNNQNQLNDNNINENNNKLNAEMKKESYIENLNNLLKNININNKENNNNPNPLNSLSQLTNLIGQLHNKSNDNNNNNNNNNKVFGDVEALLSKFLNLENQKKNPYSLDKSVMDNSSSLKKESILLEYDNNGKYLNDKQNLINQNNNNLNEKNEKLKNFFSSLKDKYNPYSYERKILNDLINENDIKSKYNLDDDFENQIIGNYQENEEYEAMNDEDKEKKTGMFEDINELDDNDTIESGSISNKLLRKNKIENDKLLRKLTSDDSDDIQECNCSKKVKNCILSYINYENLEYMLESLDIDVKTLIRKYNGHVDKQFKKTDSFLIPLPPLNPNADVQNTSDYVLRVPRVLFLTTRKSFSSSFDRYFYNLYNIMATHLKWNAYMWGYGFKYYPVFFPKNLHTLLNTYSGQIGNEPFDIIFIHNSFVSNYYNHFFFLKNMPKLTTLIYINDGWDANMKKTFLNLFPHIFFQNQVNIFEFNPLNSIDVVEEKKKLFNNLWNKVSNSNASNVITNRHKKRNEIKNKPISEKEKMLENEDDSKTLWAFLPHGVNHCCSKYFNLCFESKENNDMNFYYNRGKKIENKHIPNYELSYSLLDLFLQECNFKETSIFNNSTRDIDILFLYNTTSNNYKDYLIQKIMDYIYNKNINDLKNKIYKYEVDLYYWKVWGLQTTHKLIKNKIKEYTLILQRSKVCVISSKFAGMLNKMVIDALFNGCVVITDKSHNKDINKYLISTHIPFEYYEISDLIYNKENMNSLANDLIDKINTTLQEVNSGKRDKMRIEAFKTVLNTYTYTGVILNWIIPSLYFHYNKEKYEITNNYFVLPQYFESIISKSLKTTSAKREKIIANIDLSLQEDLIMNNNEVAVWCIIWILIFSIILFYILKNSNIISFFLKKKRNL
ncbi:conserved Plasmodium protein, unknown function [Plasmodium relictum]|uniref:Golgi protein 2 n=1 Tax=Plasmodium relictum TaxID=85471 RepID=A0A1J1H5B3_PLARL|nr:conserved Plasmodium protein, unknown function [Plasmodium relictum]CRH00103.1 conserved Plasmodium protein, unknown function [Plasmodium relictum]